MRVGQRVLVFTASGTFRGVQGRVVDVAGDLVRVAIEGEPEPLFFTSKEIVPASEPSLPVGGAE